MRRWFQFGLAVFFGGGAAPAFAGWQPSRGTNQVDFVRYSWHDTARDRDVPVKIYFPRAGRGPFPVIIFSHGLGGSREGYRYLGEYWARHGYVSVHLQHLGSDDAIWKEVNRRNMERIMLGTFENPQNAINRAEDVSFAIDRLEEMNAEAGPLAGRLDLRRIGMAGHSFGAQTALIAVGERAPELNRCFADPRIQAAIAMSPPIPELKSSWAATFAPIHRPVFVMTGTLDALGTPAGERRVAYDKVSAPGSCLVIFNGLDHLTFSGHFRLLQRGKDRKFQPLICVATAAFWDAHLRGDTNAAAWLEHGGFAAFIGRKGKVESK